VKVWCTQKKKGWTRHSAGEGCAFKINLLYRPATVEKRHLSKPMEKERDPPEREGNRAPILTKWEKQTVVLETMDFKSDFS